MKPPARPLVDENGLGALGSIDHNATIPPHITVGMIGRRYRLVVATVKDGDLTEEPFDDRMFDSVHEARKAAAIAKATGAA